MVNDTTTLNGALTELGETMAANLVTKGVTTAQASDGLTTLAGDILNIPATSLGDYMYFDCLETDLNRYTLTQGSGTLTYNSSGLKVYGSAGQDTYWYSPDYFLPTGDYTIEYEWVDYNSGWSVGFGCENFFFEQDSNGGIAFKVNGSEVLFLSGTTVAKGSVMKLEVTGTTTKQIKVYDDGTLLATISNVPQTRKQFFKTYRSRYCVFHNLKIYY